MTRSAVLFLLLVPYLAHAQHSHDTGSAPVKLVLLETGLGNVFHPVSTKNRKAQAFFNQGLAYIYAFNHAEAVKAFTHAAVLDPDLAMAYWGTALALGSNYNLPADSAALKQAYASLQRAKELAPRASVRDRAYIEALSHRYAADPNSVDTKEINAAYKTAMGELVRKYPNDLDAATLYAESMMNLRPWQLWTADGKPADGTLEIVSVLEDVLRRNPNHVGANHYYIHAIEASRDPNRGLPSAKRLGGIAPNAGHLVHMPSHIYIRTGDYAEAARVNADAIVVDKKYISKNGPGGVYPMMYYTHNVHFLASANAMNGNYSVAIKTARQLHDIAMPMVSEMPMLEGFVSYPLVTLVRFRKWEVILREAAPAPELKVMTAFYHFARGVAFAETGKPDEAKAELAALSEVYKMIPADRPFGNSTAVVVLKVAKEFLAGEAALARGHKKDAIHEFEQAVLAENAVTYAEPPDWDLPSREWLGRALLTDGQYAEAEKVYREELTVHPKNARALFGLTEALKKQNKNAATVQKEFRSSWTTADTKLTVTHLYFSK
ncbi:MAG: tetratricopeptide repeat protein [Pyrinomonadaceae bacterium]